MTKRAKARRAIPTPTSLESRLLPSFVPTWIGQDGHDSVGTAAPSPNDYQDIHIHLSGLKPVGVRDVQVYRLGGDAWDTGINASFRTTSGDPSRGDLFLEPYHSDGLGQPYQIIRVTYSDDTQESYESMGSATEVDANLRVPGRGMSA